SRDSLAGPASICCGRQRSRRALRPRASGSSRGGGPTSSSAGAGMSPGRWGSRPGCGGFLPRWWGRAPPSGSRTGSRRRSRGAGPAVLHLAGERDFEELRKRVARADYRLLAYTSEFGSALAAADLVVARAGGSVWELAAAGKPAVLVPYPYATADHQTKNAAYF